MQTEAQFYDGETAGSVPARLTLFGSKLQIDAGGTVSSFDVNDLELMEPVGSGAWVIDFEDGASLRIEDNDFGQLLADARGDAGLVRYLEHSWQWAIIALVVAVISTWALLTWGVPVAARHVAFALPDDISMALSDDSMEILDKTLFDPSQLSREQKQRVRTLFKEIRASNQEFARYRLEFRASSIGANAFAVPGGIVVMTDDMVELVESDDELIAVLAHEIGHLYNRHSLRIVLQDSTSAVIIASITGDLTNITALGAAIPTILMQAKYSRDFEREADEFSFAYMESKGMDTRVLSELLQRLSGEDDTENPLGDWLSSHPRPEERVRDE